MITYSISKSNPSLKGEITLSPSKSISNKYLVIRILKSAHLNSQSASETDDSQIVNNTILNEGIEKNRGSSAKAIRHIRSFISYFGGTWTLSFSKVLRDQSAKMIVDLLQKHGLNVQYEERNGNPPFRLIGKNLSGIVHRVEGSINSKVIEARLLMEPDATIDQIQEFANFLKESGYVGTTLRALQYLGVNTDWHDDELLIQREIIDGSELSIEPDWFQAAIWYSFAALADKAKLTISGIKCDTFQPEVAAKDIFKSLGVTTEIFPEHINIERKGKSVKLFKTNIKESPNLLAPIITTCVGLNIPFEITGIDNLTDKHSETLNHLTTELNKLGATITIDDKQTVISYNGKNNLSKLDKVTFDTHECCTLALVLTPFTLKGIEVTVINPWVTNKVYPAFWDDLKKFEIFVRKD